MMKTRNIIILSSILICLPLYLALADNIPLLKRTDVEAIYGKDKSHLFIDWSWKGYQRNVAPEDIDLVEECETDYVASVYPLIKAKHPSITNKLEFSRVLINPWNSTIYYIFNVDPDVASDYMIVYVVNADTKSPIFKVIL